MTDNELIYIYIGIVPIVFITILFIEGWNYELDEGSFISAFCASILWPFLLGLAIILAPFCLLYALVEYGLNNKPWKKFKIILILLSIDILVQSCTTSIDRDNTQLIINRRENSVNYHTKYWYSFKDAYFIYYTDSLYNMGNTLVLVKKK